jgi:hypothetical protein
MLAAAAPAAADTVRCAGPGGSPTVALELAITPDETRVAGAVTRLDADVGDLVISTAGTAPERIAGQEGGTDRLTVDVSDPGDVWIVLRLRLVRDVAYRRLQGDETDANPLVVVAGTLSVLGVGVWPVTCTGW